MGILGEFNLAPRAITVSLRRPLGRRVSIPGVVGAEGVERMHAFDKELPVLLALLAVALQPLGALEPLVLGLDFEQFRSHFHLSGFF